MLGMVYKVIEQLFTKKSTNPYPTKYLPKNIRQKVHSGAIQAPVEVNEGFRGKLVYDFESCIGCGLCVNVCPAKAIELYPVFIQNKKSRRIILYLSRCTFCQECVTICPRHSLRMTKEFCIADYNKYSDSMIVGIDWKKRYEVMTDGDTVLEKK